LIALKNAHAIVDQMIVCEAGTKRNKKAFKSSQATSNTAQREKTAKHFYTVWSPHDFAK